MTKDELKQYRDLKREIKRLDMRIEKLKSQNNKIEHDRVTGSNDEFPYQSMSVNIEGVIDNGPKIRILDNILRKRKNTCEELQLKIEVFISEIPDSRTRQVFEMRYYDGLPWLSISKHLDSLDESYSRKMHDRYLKKI